MGHARRDQAQTATDPATGRARKTAHATERLIPDHIGPRERRDPTRDPTSRHRHRALEFCGSKFSSFFWVWPLASPKSKSSCDCGIWRFNMIINLQTAGFGAVATFELGVPARDACSLPIALLDVPPPRADFQLLGIHPEHPHASPRATHRPSARSPPRHHPAPPLHRQ